MTVCRELRVVQDRGNIKVIIIVIMIRSNLSTTEYWWSLAGDINQSNALNK